MPRDFFRSAALDRIGCSETARAAAEPEVTPAVLGARIRRLREIRDLTVRDLADKAGIDKSTVVRAEQGKPVSHTTLRRLCAALSTTLVGLLLGDAVDGGVAEYHAGQDMDLWIRHSTVGTDTLNVADVEELRSPAARRGAAAAGEAAFNNILSSQLAKSRLRPSILELYSETIRRTHPGEEWVMCLKGELLLTVAGQPILLGEGDSAAFSPTEVHTYAPSPTAVATGDIPVLALSIRLDPPERRSAASAAETAGDTSR